MICRRCWLWIKEPGMDPSLNGRWGWLKLGFLKNSISKVKIWTITDELSNHCSDKEKRFFIELLVQNVPNSTIQVLFFEKKVNWFLHFRVQFEGLLKLNQEPSRLSCIISFGCITYLSNITPGYIRIFYR